MSDQANPTGREPMLKKDAPKPVPLTESEPGLGSQIALLHAVEMLEHSDLAVRQKALATLTQFGSEEAYSALVNFLELNHRAHTTRARVTQAIGMFAGDQAVPHLLRLSLEDDNQAVRAAASRALSKIGASNVIPQLMDALASRKWKTRRNATEALYFLPDRRCTETLLRLLRNDQNWVVRHRAAEALGEIRDMAAFDTLMEVIQTSDDVVRSPSIIALGKLGDTRAIDILINFIVNHWWEKDAAQALNLIGTVGIHRLAELLEADDEEVRMAVTRAFQEIGTEQVLSCLLSASHDTSAAVRGSAAVALGQFKTKYIVEILKGMLKDTSPWVRERAAEALGEIKLPGVVDILADVLGDSDKMVGRTAARGLWGMGKAGQAVLESAITNANWRVRKAAVSGLWKQRNVGNVKVLAWALDDPNMDVYRDAKFGLEVIGTPEALQVIQDWERRQR